DGVLVDKLGMSVPPEKHGEVVEPGYDALQLDPVHQEHRHRRLVLADGVEEHILDVLGFFCGHRSRHLLVLLVVCLAPSLSPVARPRFRPNISRIIQGNRSTAEASLYLGPRLARTSLAKALQSATI